MNHAQFPAIAALAFAAVVGAAPLALAQSNVCANCGVVQSIQYVEEKGKTSGVGAVVGGVAGGVLGHQVGSGRGNTVATVAGAAGGAYVGNKVEQNKKKKSYYNVTVKLDNGKTRTVTSSSAPTVKEGERVKILDGNRLALITK
jgi:outer membrane lipoprotein SlyB